MAIRRTGYSDPAALAGMVAFFTTYAIVMFVFAIIMIIAYWKVFTKAGEAGWQSIIPIWNVIVILKIAGRPWWWILLMLIPIVDIVIVFIVYNDISKSFGHGIGFTLGLIFLAPIFWLILGFGSSRYVGPAGLLLRRLCLPGRCSGSGSRGGSRCGATSSAHHVLGLKTRCGTTCAGACATHGGRT